ncbi:MAG TPA: hypothetical protein ENN36_08905 [Candidatus Bathyarchaeota archaeon]|nr:hypothetical protein [Candidatus Bathyarchaeota archaeon]
MKSENKQSITSPFCFASFLLVIALCGVLVNLPKAQCADAQTVGLWHLDEVEPADYMEITPDATGYNHGTLGGEPPPTLVEGKFGKALSFRQSSFVYVPIAFLVGFPPTPKPIYIPVSPNLDIKKELKIEAWINVQAFTNATYNNIVVKCTRTGPEVEDVTRVFGLAVKPSLEQEEVGVLSGCVYTDSSGFNEILTAEPVIPLNQWINVAFTRTSAGMHLYVNGEEQNVKAIEGVQNPSGSIINGTEVYIGHDSEVIIDEVKISDLAPEKQVLSSQIDIGNNLLIAIVIAVVAFATAWVLRKAIQMWVIYSKSRK